MSSLLARDTKGGIVQALAPMAKLTLAIGAASTSGALPVAADATAATVLRLAANQRCYFLFGFGSAPTVTSATGHALGINSELVKVPTGATHIATIQDGAVTGSLTISSME